MFRVAEARGGALLLDMGKNKAVERKVRKGGGGEEGQGFPSTRIYKVLGLGENLCMHHRPPF